MRFQIRKRLPAQVYIDGILAGDRIMLSRAITLVESKLDTDRTLAEALLEALIPHTGRSVRVGITGVPGVGKSTFIESLGLDLLAQQHKLAVLAIDPSSQRSGGSILGDKTRMEELSRQAGAFIRPTAAGHTLGGVASRTREAILLCEAAGYDVVLVETVGVGQSEIAVHGMVDFFMLLMLAGAGDELQGIKKGIMEMADAVVITKADGDNKDQAKRAKREYQNALHLFPATETGWQPKVLTASALEHRGLDTVWGIVQDYVAHMQERGHFEGRRQAQNLHWMEEVVREQLQSNFYHHPSVQQRIETARKAVALGKLPAIVAAKELLKAYYR